MDLAYQFRRADRESRIDGPVRRAHLVVAAPHEFLRTADLPRLLQIRGRNPRRDRRCQLHRGDQGLSRRPGGAGPGADRHRALVGVDQCLLAHRVRTPQHPDQRQLRRTLRRESRPQLQPGRRLSAHQVHHETDHRHRHDRHAPGHLGLRRQYAPAPSAQPLSGHGQLRYPEHRHQRGPGQARRRSAPAQHPLPSRRRAAGGGDPPDRQRPARQPGSVEGGQEGLCQARPNARDQGRASRESQAPCHLLRREKPRREQPHRLRISHRGRIRRRPQRLRQPGPRFGGADGPRRHPGRLGQLSPRAVAAHQPADHQLRHPHPAEQRFGRQGLDPLRPQPPVRSTTGRDQFQCEAPSRDQSRRCARQEGPRHRGPGQRVRPCPGQQHRHQSFPFTPHEFHARWAGPRTPAGTEYHQCRA
ncbi:hypothetical protein NRB20_75440 [Nocardia sp. RB20]|uniref:Uncharacterized protein n=1 Tax=Nocardia macrotermitis TaxID=2585198 RepID=A0A7K0DFH8_9NOCA|nr:hypothetical protein [Nocardia macrotermitis]